MEATKSEVGDASAKPSPQALDILRSLDSLSYGVLELHTNDRSSFSGGARENSHIITRDLIKQGISYFQGSVAKLSYSPYSQAQVICQIAHLHLLLEEFTRAYSAYMQYEQLSPSSDSDPAFFYGLGIIHCRHRHFKHSEEAYKKVLSLAPSFPRLGEVHLQLGLLLKRRKAYEEAAVHFDKALNKQDPHLDKFLIQFHSAHVLELQGHNTLAREKYDVLLGCRTISPHVKALTQKQLGWLLHRCPNVVKPGEEGVRERALELLKQATQSMPECGETWYLLGRVLVTHQLCHEAFSAYQKSIHYPSKISPANTWHSIGHLYFQMRQPRDSLQAYLCCVYLDIHHLQCWKSLGCLYEAVVHPVEALLCYHNAMIAFSKKGVKVGKNLDYVFSRIDALNQYLNALGGKPCVQNPGMPRLCEAWGKLVPDHIRHREPNPGTPLLTLNQSSLQGMTTLPSLPSFPPQDPLTLINPGSLSGVVTASLSSQNKIHLENMAEKKPPAVRRSSGSTPSPPVHTTSTALSTQNGNGDMTANTAMECNPELATPTVPGSTVFTSTSVDLNGINLDNLDFDALTAAANAIPSPASLAARSRVKVTSSTHTETASTNTSSQGSTSLSTALSHTTCSPSTFVPSVHTFQPSSLQAHPHSHSASTTTQPSLIPSLSSPSFFIPSVLSTTSHPLMPSAEAAKPVQGTFEVGHSNYPPPLSLASSQSSNSGTVRRVTNSTGSLFQNTSSHSRTPGVTRSHNSSASIFNWSSYTMEADQKPSTNSSPAKPCDPLQQKPPTAPHPSTTTSQTFPLASLPSTLPAAPTVSQMPLQHPVSVSPAPKRPASLPVQKQKRRSSDKSLPCKRKPSASSSAPSKSSVSRRRLSETNTSKPSPKLALSPSRAVEGSRARRRKSSDGVFSPLTPLPPNMASDPTFLSQIGAASFSAAPLSIDLFLSGRNNSLPHWTASAAGFGSQNGTTFGQNGFNQMVPLMTTQANGSGPSSVHNTMAPFTKPTVPSNTNHSMLPMATTPNNNQSGQMFIDNNPPLTTVSSGVPIGHNTYMTATMTNPRSGTVLPHPTNPFLTAVSDHLRGTSANNQTSPYSTTNNVAQLPNGLSHGHIPQSTTTTMTNMSVAVSGHNQTSPHSATTTIGNPFSIGTTYSSSLNQTMEHSTTTTMANPLGLGTMSSSSFNQTMEHSTTTTMANPLGPGTTSLSSLNQTMPTITPSGTLCCNTSQLLPVPSSPNEPFVSKKPRLSPEAQSKSNCSSSPFQLPTSLVSAVHTSLSPFHSNPPPITAHREHPHKIRLHSESESKTVRHHASTLRLPSLPSASFAGLPLFSPPPPLPSPNLLLPTAADHHTPQITSSLPTLPQHVTPPASTMAYIKQQLTRLPPTAQPSPMQQELSLTLQQAQQHAVLMSQVGELAHIRRPPSQESLSREQPQQTGLQDLQRVQQHTSQPVPCQTEQMSATVSLATGNRNSVSDPSPQGGPTMTVLTSSASKLGEPSASRPPSSSEEPVTSVQNLVNQLFAVLQQKDGALPVSGTAETVVHSPSDSSSGVSSAKTTLSTFSTASTAESSPVDLLGNQFTTTYSLPQNSPSLFPSSLHFAQQPSLSSPAHPSPVSPFSPLHFPHTLTAAVRARRPRLSSCGSSPMGEQDESVPRVTKEVENEPHLRNDHQNNTKLCALNNKRLYLKYSLSKFVAPLVPFPSLASIKEYMILDPELRPPNSPPFQPGTELRPECPLYEVTSYEDAMSTRLHEFCNDPSVPICIVRGLVEAIGLDLNMFSSQCLVETCSDHEMEVREQMKQAADENCDVVTGRQAWKCESSKTVTTVNEYAKYQQKMLQRELEEKQSGHVSEAGGREEKGEREFLSFGTNVDISDKEIWSEQLAELHKLPPYLRVSCPEMNLLSHIGHTILGMNSVQLYMKVAGSRTPGHQENNNFCSLNINIGPGNCEWFAVPNSYWGALHSLCEKHKVNFLVGSWWPILDELYRHKVPVYRFTQYKGDVVYINPGTVHWVQANSTCNNIAWNTGPLTAHQFRMSWERYQWNKIQKVRSIVPMIHLTWNLARHITVTDSHFYSQVRSLLESSLAQTNLLLSHLKRAGIPVVWHGRLDGEPAPYCNDCMEEVFNILFVLSHRGEYLVYCHRCASSMRKTFTVLQQYQTEDLEEVVTSFRLHSPMP